MKQSPVVGTLWISWPPCARGCCERPVLPAAAIASAAVAFCGGQRRDGAGRRPGRRDPARARAGGGRAPPPPARGCVAAGSRIADCRFQRLPPARHRRARSWPTLLPPERLSARLRALPPGPPPVVELVDSWGSIPTRRGRGTRAFYRDAPRDCTPPRARRRRLRRPHDRSGLHSPPRRPRRPSSPPPPPTVVSQAAPAPAPPPPRGGAAGRRGRRRRLPGPGASPADRVAQGGVAARVAIGRGRLASVAGRDRALACRHQRRRRRRHQWRLPVDAGIRAQLTGHGFARYGDLACGRRSCRKAPGIFAAANRRRGRAGRARGAGVRAYAGASRPSPRSTVS